MTTTQKAIEALALWLKYDGGVWTDDTCGMLAAYSAAITATREAHQALLREGEAIETDWLRGDWYEAYQDCETALDEGGVSLADLERLRGRVEQTILAALDQTPGAQGGWMPIETAPKDGTKFDVWVPDSFGGRRMTNLSFNARGKLRQNGLLTEADLPRWPTHWMRLPQAPGESE